MKNVVFCVIKTQFGLHRKHIADPLQSYVRFEVFTAVTKKNVFFVLKTQYVPHRKPITSLL
jgi:hypothetical protein